MVKYFYIIPVEVDGRIIAEFRASLPGIAPRKSAEERVGQ